MVSELLSKVDQGLTLITPKINMSLLIDSIICQPYIWFVFAVHTR